MVISINYSTKVIFIPKSYLTLVSGVLFDLDTNQLRKDLKGLEASKNGMVFLDTHQHNTEVTISGVIYARLIEFINGYTITFEPGNYRVRFNGSNNNIADVLNHNSTGILSQNSAGLTSRKVGRIN